MSTAATQLLYGSFVMWWIELLAVPFCSWLVPSTRAANHVDRQTGMQAQHIKPDWSSLSAGMSWRTNKMQLPQMQHISFI